MKKPEIEAKKNMLRKMKQDMREKMNKGLPEHFKSKKVVVEADSPEGLEKGLSMAQKILKAKLEKGADMEDMEEMMEESSEDCEECGKEDCYKCGGVEKYEDGGMEEEPGFMQKYMKGFQGSKPMESQASIDSQSDETKEKLAKLRKAFN